MFPQHEPISVSLALDYFCVLSMSLFLFPQLEYFTVSNLLRFFSIMSLFLFSVKNINKRNIMLDIKGAIPQSSIVSKVVKFKKIYIGPRLLLFLCGLGQFWEMVGLTGNSVSLDQGYHPNNSMNISRSISLRFLKFTLRSNNK